MQFRHPRDVAPVPPDQPVVVDLGCGPRKRGHIGIDVYPWPGVDIVCNLGFEPIPLVDDSVDQFKAWDVLEHIPGDLYYKEGGRWHAYYPRIQLLREIHRCLRPGGTFESYTPVWPHPSWAQDPTHTGPPWVREAWDYYCGGFGGRQGWPGRYGIDFAFRLVTAAEHPDGHLHVVVAKP